ncbi:hypothetical protein ACP275_05G075600 [Erythranthe tilingii]
MESSLVLHQDEKEGVRNPDEILVRRLKNRERQRRYRARKRNQADLEKTSIVVVDQSTSLHYQHMSTQLLPVPVQVDISLNVTPPDSLITRVHCKRDWKKDARTVHIHNKQETVPIGPSQSSASFLECGLKADLPLNHSNTDNNSAHRFQSSRRHWKAEARNKKSSECEIPSSDKGTRVEP